MTSKVSGSKIASSFAWVIIEKFGYSGVTLISTFVLARLLTPKEFGMVGAVTIVTSIANMIVESGLGSALINKSYVDNDDYNTVFTFNLFLSCSLFFIIFFSAPTVSRYLEAPQLMNILRFLSLSLIFNAITLVQRTILIKQLLFKKQSFITLTSLVVSLLIAILFAVIGWGVWALVIQLVSYSALFSVLTVFTIRYKPRLFFSKQSFRELYKYGGRIMLSSTIQTVYDNIVATLIAKFYSFQVTGYYTQAQKLTNFPLNIFRSLFEMAAFPILSVLKGDEFVDKCSKLSRSIYLIAFPLLLSIPFTSSKIIAVALGNQWIQSNNILGILSVGIIFLLINISTFNVLKSAGEAKVFLKLGIYKTVFGLIILFITLFFSIELLLYGIILTNLVASVVGILKVSQQTLYKVRRQIVDIFTPLMLSILSNLIIYLILKEFVIHNNILYLVSFLVFNTLLFVLFCKVLRLEELDFIINQIRERRK